MKKQQKPKVAITIYRASDGWRWRARTRNGRIIADSGEAYVSKSNAENGITALAEAFKAGSYEVIRKG